ncbi:MAG: hypothetical protein NT154_26235, partial [Verrucomicrobia bacterium]|nr:hypothetical protein [Verrucomicrobiota bacterium]
MDVRLLSSSSAQLVWPNTNETFVLEGRNHLTASNAWEAIGQWPQLAGNEFTVIVPLTNAQQFFRLRQVATIQLPPDPAAVAPPQDPTLATTVCGATEVRYTGTNAIQTGVASNTIVPRQAGVLRGRVLDRQGAALPGVAITVLGHPEFGRTWSRLDGRFDLAVNSGGYLTVNYKKAGFTHAQRQISVAWQEYVQVPDVALLARD